ncbi:MAE_28990/MAE_18760 family HEPN-like nuclease [Gallaecimonas kandeliae]|uniref:MAE_28990/MAE_18760 family HEPN-like nuclease n=1 Tax=Gallaecimonas kandeliae TaxID=3029055 RepID=UPI0026473F0D|nr:MAE_28990/MAE_18760 family HEPN-like nuclease [Gallaecimonas kandeliae]WKE64031.1 MAE_28990/MAE_18760 family HEPN-like nuclease [Gallaecimonas kandeliae]
MPSKARIALDENLKDVEGLLDLHTLQGGNAPGRRFGLEVLNKSAIVLITSYWEAYCEDIAEEGLEHIVAHAATADVLPTEIKKIIAKELKAENNEIAVWKLSDDKWRQLLQQRLQTLKESRNRKLNTPKYKNIDDLFESAIGLTNVSGKWVWAKKLTAAKARDKLDKFVELRGEIAHRGKAKTSVKKSQVEDYLDFIKNAAAKTGGAVNTHVKAITGKVLWD